MQSDRARTIVFSGLIAAAYAVITLALSPVGYGPIQFRVASMIVPIVLVDRRYSLGVCIGIALANMMSPFGIYDFLIMPMLSFVIYQIGWQLRWNKVLSLSIMAVLTGIAVSIFPLHLGAGLPILPTMLWVSISTWVMFIAGWFVIWTNFSNFR